MIENRAAGTRSEVDKKRRKTNLLSGLLHCGTCNDTITSSGKDNMGNVGVHCCRHNKNRTCSEPESYRLDGIEHQVVIGIKPFLTTTNKMKIYFED